MSGSANPWDDDTEELTQEELEELVSEALNALDEETVSQICDGECDYDSISMNDCDGDGCSGNCDCVTGESWWKEGEVAPEKRCECGASACGSPNHSTYCPMYEK